MSIECFEDIEGWKKGRELTRAIYRLSRRGAFARDFALVDQIRRAAISITSNIAEGFEREGDKEFLQALSIAKGSCGEVRSQLYVAHDDAYISESEFKALQSLALETSRVISGFMKYLKASTLRGSKFREPPTRR